MPGFSFNTLNFVIAVSLLNTIANRCASFPFSFRWEETNKNVNWAKSGRNLRGNFACFDPHSNNDKRAVTACAYNSLYFLRYRKGRSCVNISENRLLFKHKLCRFVYRSILPRLKYSCLIQQLQFIIQKDCDINWGRNCFAGLLNWTAP